MQFLPFQAISYVPSMIFTKGYSSGEIEYAAFTAVNLVHHCYYTDSAFMDSRKKRFDRSRRLTGCLMFRCFFNMRTQYIKTRLQYDQISSWKFFLIF